MVSVAEAGEWSYCLMYIQFQFYKMKRIIEMDCSDVSTALLTYLKPLS